MKRKKILVVISVFCFLFSVFWIWWFWATSPVCQNNCQAKIFVVERGESLGSVAQKLEKEGLIRSSLAFQFLASREGITRKIQAGDFRLSPKTSPLEIARELTHGSLDRWVTIIEGWRREEIAEKLSRADLEKFSREEFLKETEKLEGKLFPDTYLIPKDATSQNVVEILTKNFSKKAPMPTKEVLILASIVEREVRGKEDRQIVAGILLKRLEKDWPLQADATVQYAVATSRCPPASPASLDVRRAGGLAPDPCQEWWPKNLTKKDLEIKSLYNTYLNRGLPPGPICNPGLAAIEAVLNPTKTDFWFYLSDPQGKIHYAKTSEEHAQNIQKYLLK